VAHPELEMNWRLILTTAPGFAVLAGAVVIFGYAAVTVIRLFSALP
jgi:hypothetical protein